jgi:hypothetical protein
MFRIGDDGRRASQAGGLALLLCFMLAPSALAQQHGALQFRVRQTAPESLTLIRPSDPIFDGMLDSYFPGLSDEAGYRTSIKPFLVIVENDTALPAVAYAVTWTVHYGSGPVCSPRAVYVNRPLMERRSTTYISPGEVRLVSPMFNVSPQEYVHSPSFARWYPAIDFFVRWAAGSTSVDVAMDGVVYADGTFIGPDRTRVLERYVMARFAARDEALAALNRIDSPPKTPLAIKGRLEEMFERDFKSNDGNVAYDNTLLSLYVSDRQRAAGDMRGVLRARGVIGLEAAVRGLIKGSGVNAKPSAFAEAYNGLSRSGPWIIGMWPSTGGTSAQELAQQWWRFVPEKIPPEPASASRRRLLAERGAYFDTRDGSSRSVDQPSDSQFSAVISEPGVVCEGGDNPPFFANEAVVVATFASYQVYLSLSRRSMYTSVRLAVEQVLEPGPSDVRAGEEIDQLLPGGTARLPSGHVRSYGIIYGPAFKDYEEKPGHRYLLFLKYVSDGNFFVEKGAWELRGGSAVPVAICDVAAAREGRSRYTGMSEAEFLAAMREAIQKHREGSPKQ